MWGIYDEILVFFALSEDVPMEEEEEEDDGWTVVKKNNKKRWYQLYVEDPLCPLPIHAYSSIWKLPSAFYDAFENNVRIKHKFEKYLKEM